MQGVEVVNHLWQSRFSVPLESFCLQVTQRMSRRLDLSKPNDVIQYLSETPFASSRVEPLSGGNINYVFRLYLRNPYDGMRTLVLKHGKGWPSGHETYSFSVERLVFSSPDFQIAFNEVTDCILELRSQGTRSREYGPSL